MRNHRSKTFLLLLFVIIFACWWGVSVFIQVAPHTAMVSQAQGPVPVAFAPSTMLVITHSVVDGVQTYQGSLLPPSLCDNLGVGNITSNAGSLHVSIALTLTTTDTCDFVGASTPDPFSIGITSATAPVFDGVTLNGVIIPSELVEKK